ncbi:MAG: carboxymuconolactone decarboxylase family protein [Candidatus Kuenenia sp.]|nr:carboxymuconolactone decarboxylase family protein [Candidatus Kuenenia hertensis]
MAEEILPKQYLLIKKKHKKFFDAVEELGKVVRQEGPIDEKVSHLVQLAAAAAIHSEGAVHSHVRRALDAGVKPEEIYHTLILLTSTIGFPSVVSALSWTNDIMKQKEK